jgi:hypothetical protein
MANYTWPSVSVSSAPIQYVLDGSNTTVTQNTGTPSASTPLPVIPLDSSGNPIPPFDPSTIEGYLSTIAGDTTAIEADVATLAGVDYATQTTLASLEAKDFATETTLALLEAKDFATETTLALLEAKDFATLTEQQTQSSTLSDISDQQLGFFDPNNSSTTSLGVSGVYTGTAIEITNYSAINVAVKSDVASATDGLSMQFSPDGINWDHTHNYTVGVGGVSFCQAVELRYFRIVYTNNTSAQTYFRLTTILKRTTVSPSRYTVEQQLFGGQMADVTKSVIWGLTTGGGGGYVAVKVNPSGALTVDATVTSSALPTGASTLAEQQTQSGYLSTISTKDFATQTTLSAVNGKLPTTLGQTTKSGSLSVTVASDQILDVKQAGLTKIQQLFNDYTTSNVTTSAYVQLVASTSAAASKVEIFDSSGELMILAVGAAASEVDQLYIFPGGNGPVDLTIPAGSRVSVKAKTATASEGYLAINLYA